MDERGRELQERVLAVVVEHAPVAASGVERLLRRRRADVRAALAELERDGRIRLANAARNGRTWEPAPPPTVSAFLGGPCPDPSSCRYRMRHAAGPWSCEFNHPRAAQSVGGAS
jgi:hypothetical protein